MPPIKERIRESISLFIQYSLYHLCLLSFPTFNGCCLNLFGCLGDSTAN
jgi:hypothetical protein